MAPGSPETHAALGILFDLQMRPGAEAEHKEAVRLAPNNPVYLNNLGFSLFLREHFKQAIGEYEKAARLAPLSHRVRTNMGFAYAAIGDLPSAAREFRMGGNEVDADNNLGFAYERRGDLANAYDLYLQAVRLDPKAARARSNLVHAAVLLGRPVPPEVAPRAGAGVAPLLPISANNPLRPHLTRTTKRTTKMTTKNGPIEERARRWLVVVALLGLSTWRGPATARTSAPLRAVVQCLVRHAARAQPAGRFRGRPGARSAASIRRRPPPSPRTTGAPSAGRPRGRPRGRW